VPSIGEAAPSDSLLHPETNSETVKKASIASRRIRTSEGRDSHGLHEPATQRTLFLGAINQIAL
jgi:hypothetical protein